MNHEQFRIGLEFWCGGKRWRCTDVGSRVVVAISLEAHEVVEIERVRGELGPPQEKRSLTNEASWLNGPPYAVVEEVFDEYSLPDCSLSPEDGADETTVG